MAAAALVEPEVMSVAASYRTARYSDGDYYDVGPLPDERIEIFLRGRER